MCFGDNKKSVFLRSYNKYMRTVSDFFSILFHGLQKSEKDSFTSITVEGKITDLLSFIQRVSIPAISVPGSLYAYMINGTGQYHLTSGNMLDKLKLDS